MKAKPNLLVRQHQLRQETLEGDREGEAPAKFPRSNPQHGAQGTAEALGRRAVEPIRHIGDRTAPAFEILRRVKQPERGEIGLGGGKPRARESRHHRAGLELHVRRKGSHRRNFRSQPDHQLEKKARVTRELRQRRKQRP